MNEDDLLMLQVVVRPDHWLDYYGHRGSLPGLPEA